MPGRYVDEDLGLGLCGYGSGFSIIDKGNVVGMGVGVGSAGGTWPTHTHLGDAVGLSVGLRSEGPARDLEGWG